MNRLSMRGSSGCTVSVFIPCLGSDNDADMALLGQRARLWVCCRLHNNNGTCVALALQDQEQRGTLLMVSMSYASFATPSIRPHRTRISVIRLLNLHSQHKARKL
jgi:hypothetical protein